MLVKKISKKLCNKYSEKLFHHAKQPVTDALEFDSKRKFQKTAETTGDLSADKITRVPKTSPRIIQRELKKKYLENNLYLQN